MLVQTVDDVRCRAMVKERKREVALHYQHALEWAWDPGTYETRRGEWATISSLYTKLSPIVLFFHYTHSPPLYQKKNIFWEIILNMYMYEYETGYQAKLNH